MYTYVVSVCGYYVHLRVQQVPLESRRGMRSPGAGITGSCERLMLVLRTELEFSARTSKCS